MWPCACTPHATYQYRWSRTVCLSLCLSVCWSQVGVPQSPDQDAIMEVDMEPCIRWGTGYPTKRGSEALWGNILKHARRLVYSKLFASRQHMVMWALCCHFWINLFRSVFDQCQCKVANNCETEQIQVSAITPGDRLYLAAAASSVSVGRRRQTSTYITLLTLN